MRGFQCVLRCKARNDIRAGDISAFLMLGGTLFEDAWEDKNGEMLADGNDIERSILANVPSDFDQFGLTWIAKELLSNVVFGKSWSGDDFGLNVCCRL